MMNRKLQLGIVFLVTSMLSCSVDETPTSKDLFGQWENTTPVENTDLVFVFAISFNSDGTYEKWQFYRQENSPTELGFNSIAYGKFELRGVRLSMTETKRLILPEGSDEIYLPLDQLIPVLHLQSQELSIAFDDRRTQMQFIFGPCAPNENCLSSMSFLRVNR